MKIVVLDGYTENPGDLSWEWMREFGDVEVYDRTTLSDIVPRIRHANVVYTNKTPLTRESIARAEELRFIGVLATGYNVVDIAAAREMGIPVSNVPAYSTDSVAQLVFALLLEVCHHVGHHSDAVHAGAWSACPDFCFWDSPLMELRGKTMGIVGYGRIGRRVAEIARAFGMNVIACTRHPGSPGCVELDELLKRSDVISLNCPLTAENEGMINRDTLSKMKRGAILINTARGQLIVEEDLKNALLTGQLRAAALDVMRKEPIPADNVLLGVRNCIITPHFAWAPLEARTRLMEITERNLRAFIDGDPINIVNR